VEKVKHSNGAPRKGYTEEIADQLEENNSKNIFRRGAMNFEDYNSYSNSDKEAEVLKSTK